MVTLLDLAIQALRDLPDDEQNLAAAAVIDYAQRDEMLELSREQLIEVERRLATQSRVLLSIDEVRDRLEA